MYIHFAISLTLLLSEALSIHTQCYFMHMYVNTYTLPSRAPYVYTYTLPFHAHVCKYIHISIWCAACIHIHIAISRTFLLSEAMYIHTHCPFMHMYVYTYTLPSRAPHVYTYTLLFHAPCCCLKPTSPAEEMELKMIIIIRKTSMCTTRVQQHRTEYRHWWHDTQTRWNVLGIGAMC